MNTTINIKIEKTFNGLHSTKIMKLLIMVLCPILPITLSTKKPKPLKYPKEIKTVGDELRAVRIYRGLTQDQASRIMKVNRTFKAQMELGVLSNSVLNLHRIYLFFGYIPTTLNIDKTSIEGKLLIHRIKFGYSYKFLAKKIGISQSTLTTCGNGNPVRKKTRVLIENYIN